MRSGPPPSFVVPATAAAATAIATALPLALAVAIVAAIACAAGCTPPSEVVHDPLRIDNPSDLTAEQLGMRAGATGVAAAEAAMRERGLTGIVRASWDTEGGRELDALAADYQSRVHLFEDGVYRQSVALGTGAVVPYTYGLRFARSRGGVALLVLYSDPLAWTVRRASAAAPRMEVVARSRGAYVRRGGVSLAQLAGRRGSVAQPLFVGYDLRDGLLLVARDDRGRVLERASVVRASEGEGELRLEMLSLAEAARCSCVDDYLRGEPPDDARVRGAWR